MPVSNTYPFLPGSIGRVFYVGDTDATLGITASDTGYGSPSDTNVTYGLDPFYPFATLAYCITNAVVAGRGDTIYVVPGTAISITTAAAIALSKAGVRIVGMGDANSRPTISWSGSTAATMTIAGAGVSLENLNLDLTGIDELVVGIQVTGADFKMKNCHVICADSGGQCVTGMTLGTGADRALFEDCTFLGDTANGTTDCKAIQITAAVLDCKWYRCYFNLIGGAGIGPVEFTAAALRVYFEDCHFENRVASATTCVDCNANAVTGAMKNCSLVLGTIATAGSGIAPVTSTGQAAFIAMIECYVVNDQDATGAGEAGALVSTAST